MNTSMEKETRKVTAFGNSLGVSIPKKMLDLLKIGRGDEMEFELIKGEIVMRKKQKLDDQVDPEMIKMLEETFRDHDELMKRLK
jgi:putative addiction module antidote